MVRTSVTHSAIASCATFLFLPHFDVICDLLLNRCTAAWNLFVKLNSSTTVLLFSSTVVLLFSSTVVLLFSSTVVLLFSSTAVLLFSSTVVLLNSSTTVLLNSSTVVLLFLLLERTSKKCQRLFVKTGSCRVEPKNQKSPEKTSIYLTHRCVNLNNLPSSSSLVFRSSVFRSLPSVFTSTIANSCSHEMKCLFRAEQMKINITKEKKPKRQVYSGVFHSVLFS